MDSKVFGIGVEAYTVGSAEFVLKYAAANKDNRETSHPINFRCEVFAA